LRGDYNPLGERRLHGEARQRRTLQHAIERLSLGQRPARFRVSSDKLRRCSARVSGPTRAIAAIHIEKPLEVGQRHAGIARVRHVGT
jgi:hypothetical protein